MLGRAYSREFEHLRGLHSAGRQDDLAGSRFARVASDIVGDADRALAVEDDPRRVGMRLDV